MEFSQATRCLLAFSAFVVVVAGLKAAAPILNPFLLSCFVAILCAPVVKRLVSFRLPVVVAIGLVLGLFLLFSALIGSLISSSAEDFSRQLPNYRERLLEESKNFVSWFDAFGFQVSSTSFTDIFDPGIAMQVAANTLTGLGGVLTNAFLILLTVVFMLLESHLFPIKLRHALFNAEDSIERFNRFVKSVNRYLAIKTAVSIATGLLISLLLFAFQIDYPVLWGVLAFLLNYVPNIGSMLAGIPAILLAYVQHGSLTTLLVMCGYGVINIVMGNIVEPKFLGRGLGLSTLVVFLSLIFWGWVLGPVGMLLSIPLTMIIKIALESNKETAWIGTLLGDGVGLDQQLVTLK